MTRHSLKSGFLAALLSASAAVAGAQPTQPAQPAPNETLVARADSITVGDYCRAARQVLQAPAVIAALGADSADARANAALICDPMLSSFSLAAVAGLKPAPLAAIARVHNGGSAVAREAVIEAMSSFRAAVRGPDVRPAVQASVPAEVNTQLIRASETAHGLLVLAARDRALVRLGNYERKLGPSSPKLNGVEVFLNYAAQRWVPTFRPTPLGGPSPLEIVASYTPGYFVMVDGHAEAVSTSEFGFRWYLFGKHFGKSGAMGMLLPSYWSLGVITASDRNGALVWPWQGADRSGAFISWGAIKVGYIRRQPGEWLFSKQFQAVPFLF